jgi:hypothetical protein
VLHCIFRKEASNESSRVTFHCLNEHFVYTPKQSSSSSIAKNDSEEEADVYDFAATHQISPEYESDDDDRLQHLAELHQNFIKRRSSTSDSEWENIVKSTKPTILDPDSPSTKVIEWMNHDADLHGLKNPDPHFPPVESPCTPPAKYKRPGKAPSPEHQSVTPKKQRRAKKNTRMTKKQVKNMYAVQMISKFSNDHFRVY